MAYEIFLTLDSHDYVLRLRFLIYLHNSKNLTPKDIPLIQSKILKFHDSTDQGTSDYTIRNPRISRNNVEMDVFVHRDDLSSEDQKGMAKHVAKLFETDIGSLDQIINLTEGLTRGLNEQTIIERAIEKFNAQHYWEAQETAESVWTKTRDPREKDVIQGFILVGAALVHHQRDQDDVCLSMLRRAVEKLDAFNQIPQEKRSFLALDISQLRSEVETMIREGKVKEIVLKRPFPG